MTEVPALGRWLKEQRRARDLTQRGLALMIGCSIRTIQKIETGERRPSRRIVDLLAECLGVPIKERPAFMRFARERASEYAPPPVMIKDPGVGVTPTWLTNTASIRQRTGSAPVYSTHFIGREEQIGEVVALLRKQSTRLVTLTGAPGIGKTRLALEVASTLESEFQHGIYFVHLVDIADAALVPRAIEQALGLKEVSSRTVQDTLVEHIQSSELLLILDNFEHVIPAGPFLADVLGACPNLRILVTSREVLHISQEREYPVPPLAFPPPQEGTSSESLEEYEAVRLFTQRAHVVSSSFSLNDSNAGDVAEICRRLEGVPLAIELAAARVKVLPPRTILQRLDHKLELLSGGPRDLPARHQTLHAAIEWSYDLLPEAERTLFERLSVFTGGCTLQAAEAICNANGDLQMPVLDGLTALVDKSLLRQAPTLSENGPRFEMLSMIKEYARKRLEKSGEEEAILKAHATFYLNAIESVEEQLRGPEQAVWLAYIEEDRDNIRAVLEWAANTRDNREERVEVGLRLANGLRWYWMSQGYLSEGRKWLSEFLDRPEASAVQVVYVRAVMTGGVLALLSADPAGARPLFTQSIEVWRDLGDIVELSRAVMGLGTVADLQREFDEAIGLYEYGLNLAKELGNDQLIAIALVGLGGAKAKIGAYSEAKLLLEESMPLLQSVSNPWVMAQAYLDLGMIALHENTLGTARGYLRQSLDMWRSLGAIDRIYLSFLVLSRVSFAQGDIRTTARFFGAIETLREVTGIRFDPPYLLPDEKIVDTAHGSLGPSEWGKAWANGRALGIEQAIELASEWLEQDYRVATPTRSPFAGC